MNKLDIPIDVLPNFWEKVEIKEGCWRWKGHFAHGYARFTYWDKGDKRPIGLQAHRVIYHQIVGPIPYDHDVHHVCENKSCVNPAHMRAVTEKEHLADLTTGCVAYINKHKTHCKHGHEFTPENTIRFSSDSPAWRHCRECNRQKLARKRAAKNGARL